MGVFVKRAAYSNVAVAKPMRARNLESLGRPGDARAYDFSGSFRQTCTKEKTVNRLLT